MHVLDPSPAAPAIPLPAGLSFLVGQDCDGRWLAVESGGLRGGIFLDKDAAIHYARTETDRRANAILFVTETLHL